MTGGKDLLPFTDPMTGKTESLKQDGPHDRRCRIFPNMGRILGSLRPADAVYYSKMR